jgi:signal transduction histidine kinase
MSRAQDNNVDSLKALLPQADSASKLRLYQALADENVSLDLKAAKQYAEHAKRLATELNNKTARLLARVTLMEIMFYSSDTTMQDALLKQSAQLERESRALEFPEALFRLQIDRCAFLRKWRMHTEWEEVFQKCLADIERIKDTRERLMYELRVKAMKARQLLDDGKTDEALKIFTENLHKAELSGDEAIIAEALKELCQYNTNVEQFAQAIKYAKKASGKFKKLRDFHNYNACLSMQADSYEAQGYLDSAVHILDYLLQYNLKTHYDIGAAFSYITMGRIKSNQGNLVDAISLVLKALRIYEDNNAFYATANARETLGDIYFKLQIYEEAISYHKEVARMTGDIVNISLKSLYNKLSQDYLATGNLRLADSLSKQALQLSHIQHDAVSELNALNTITEIQMKKHGLDSALMLSRKAELLIREANMPLAEMNWNNLRGEILLLKNQEHASMPYFIKSHRLSRAFKNVDQRLRAAKGMSSALSALGRNGEAYPYIYEYVRLKDSVYYSLSNQQVTEQSLRYESAKREAENKTLRTKQLLSERTVERQRYIIAIVSILLLSLLFISFFLRKLVMARKRANVELYKKNQQILLQNEEILSQNEEIASQKESITEQRDKLEQALRELQNTQTQLIHSEKMASLGQLIAGIAHEINNPMNFITGGVSGLQEQIKEAQEAFHKLSNIDTPVKAELQMILNDMDILVTTIEKGTKRASNIVNGLRKISHDSPELYSESDIKENIDLALLLLQNEWKNRIEIVKEYKDVPMIACNPGEINQVLINLLINAIQAIPGEGKIIIGLDFDKQAELLMITIEDNGVGIRPEDLSKIFDPFYTTKEVGKGTGLGLAISKKIIDSHHGTLRVSSIQGKGTIFNITLPENMENA